MSHLRVLALSALVLALTGCASVPDRDEARACPADPATALNTPRCVEATAALGFEYAILAALAYEPAPPPDFSPPPGVTETESCTETACEGVAGYQYRVFSRVRYGKVVERIIAFRGTDQRADWATNIFGKKGQNRAALETFLKVRGDGSVPVSVTGHSLGGALATQVSMCYPVHMRVSFDSSPRFYQRLCPGGRAIPKPADAGVKLLHFSEYGEFLGPLRLIGRDPDQITTPLDCVSQQHTIDQHSIRQLTVCMVNISITGGSEEAQQYREQNINVFDKYMPRHSH